MVTSSAWCIQYIRLNKVFALVLGRIWLAHRFSWSFLSFFLYRGRGCSGLTFTVAFFLDISGDVDWFDDEKRSDRLTDDELIDDRFDRLTDDKWQSVVMWQMWYVETIGYRKKARFDEWTLRNFRYRARGPEIMKSITLRGVVVQLGTRTYLRTSCACSFKIRISGLPLR